MKGRELRRPALCTSQLLQHLASHVCLQQLYYQYKYYIKQFSGILQNALFRNIKLKRNKTHFYCNSRHLHCNYNYIRSNALTVQRGDPHKVLRIVRGKCIFQLLEHMLCIGNILWVTLMLASS